MIDNSQDSDENTTDFSELDKWMVITKQQTANTQQLIHDNEHLVVETKKLNVKLSKIIKDNKCLITDIIRLKSAVSVLEKETRELFKLTRILTKINQWLVQSE